MDGPANVMLALIIIGLPVLMMTYVLSRWFKLKEKRLEVDARMAVEKAAQYVSHSKEIEQRLAVLERIVTDQPHALAREIDSLSIAKPAPEKDLA
ncbi:MAG: hypothetical protein ABIR51_08170 [Sphingomicrobium sp.]